MKILTYIFCAYISFILSISSAQALAIEPEDAIKQAIQENLKKPEAEADGRVQTLNDMGAMSPRLDKISEEFVYFAAKPGVKVLEIGAGYGLACMEALKIGAQDYTVNDLDLRHLKILALQIKELDKNYLSKIHLLSGEFPGTLEFTSSYDAILIARVLHFMSPEEVSRTLEQAYKILRPGGRIYAVMLTPYVRGFVPFIPEFEKRIVDKEPFPGYVENLCSVADRSVIPEIYLKNMEKPFLFFNIDTAKNCFENNGFIVEKAIEMPLAYPSRIWQLDGRENIGIIGYKPEE